MEDGEVWRAAVHGVAVGHDLLTEQQPYILHMCVKVLNRLEQNILKTLRTKYSNHENSCIFKCTKQTHKYREQINGYHWGKGRGRGNIGLGE